MSKLAVYNREGKESASIDLPKDIFDAQVNQDVIHQAILMYQASLRQGNASTKTRGEISGGGKKPFKQKGTGRARAGSTRSPLWKKGGVVFGPHPRDFGYSLPKKIRRAALIESLKARLNEKRLVCIEDLKDNFSKTKEFSSMLSKLNVEGKVVASLDGSHDTVQRVSRNIAYFELVRSQDINALDILKNKFVVLTQTAFNDILNRISDKEK
ncbi:MAG: 50S ribosomal protein L4 [Candidatus Omnitrophica bacterium]|nr:50S ribosomal protein L4 [Candidatus Omnitrophota bacterium]